MSSNALLTDNIKKNIKLNNYYCYTQYNTKILKLRLDICLLNNFAKIAKNIRTI